MHNGPLPVSLCTEDLFRPYLDYSESSYKERRCTLRYEIAASALQKVIRLNGVVDVAWRNSHFFLDESLILLNFIMRHNK